jgi:hypothetical protein
VDQSGTNGRSDHVDFCGHQDNCSYSKLYVLMLLPMHQDVQDKIYDEIVATFDGNKRPTTSIRSDQDGVFRTNHQKKYETVPGGVRCGSWT